MEAETFLPALFRDNQRAVICHSLLFMLRRLQWLSFLFARPSTIARPKKYKTIVLLAKAGSDTLAAFQKQRQFTKLWATVVTLLERKSDSPFRCRNLGQQTLPKKPIRDDGQSINLGSKSSNRKFFNCKKRYNVSNATWSNPHRPQKLQKKVPAIGIPLPTIPSVTPKSPALITRISQLFSTSGCSSRLILLFSK